MFQKLESFTKDISDLADQPVLSPTQMKEQFDAAPNELREKFNSLIDALKTTQAGDSGAKNIGVTSISGLTGNDVQSLLESLNTLTAKKAQESWSDLTTVNGWTNFGYEHRTLQYRKNEFGDVEIRGVIGGGATAQDTVICTLPTGYRPLMAELFTVSCYNGTTKANAILKVNPNGTVAVDHVPGNFWLTLSGIKFSVN